jgi:hypothetical protein
MLFRKWKMYKRIADIPPSQRKTGAVRGPDIAGIARNRRHRKCSLAAEARKIRLPQISADERKAEEMCAPVFRSASSQEVERMGHGGRCLQGLRKYAAREPQDLESPK